ncbi:DnaJ protein, putative [Plasmodium vinckei]|uniref:DnaJ protein, putative n=1 Tax=Plasmodium vinckei TaxID=5860 RepID=A0A6V7T7A2_PLAVN|nr:DnaJ protein, putative [Plasmodium vinckei]
MKNDDYLSWCTNDKKKYKYKFLDEDDGVKEDNSSSTSDGNKKTKKKKKKKKNSEQIEKNKEQAKSFEKTDQVNNSENMDKDTPTNVTTKDNSKNLKCQICNQAFDSRNKLFEHIKAEGHMANKVIVPPSKSKKKNKKKGE